MTKKLAKSKAKPQKKVQSKSAGASAKKPSGKISKIKTEKLRSGKSSKAKSSQRKSSQMRLSKSAASSGKQKGTIDWYSLSYHNGFGNHVESEAEKGALPIGMNNPQKCPMGLYAEQISGTPFTYAKHKNKRSWLYRVVPTCNHGDWKDCSN